MEKIAFIITVYKNDDLEFFKQAIDSIISQDYGFENINLYLGVDGVLTREVEQYIQNNHKLFYKIIRNTENKGLAYTLNRLLENLEQEQYIFRMDADDIARKDRVSKTLKTFMQHPDCKLIGSDMIDIDENGKELRYKKMPVTMDEIITYAISRNPINHPTAALRREFFDIVGKYNESMLKSQDYELWARALKKNVKITNINEPLLYFRTTDTFLNKRNDINNYLAEIKISMDLMIYFKRYSQFPKIIAKFITRLMPASFGKFIYNMIRA